MKCYIGLDIGTSAVKGVLLSQEGKVLARSSGQFEYFRRDRARLMDPAKFTEICFGVIKELAGYPDTEIAAICPGGAAGNLILLDEEYSPLIPIIGWQSEIPGEDFEEYFEEEEKKDIYRKVGWPALNSFPLAYLMQIKKERPELIRKAAKICMHIEYLNFVLCGKFGISPSMGTPFYLIEQEKGIYDKKLLGKIGIDEERLPPIFEKGYVLGSVGEEIGKKIAVSPETKVVLGTFDHPAGALGAGVLETGEMLLSCGTSWVELFPSGSRDKAIATGYLVDKFLLSGASYCVMRSLTSVSEKISEYRNHFFGDFSFADFDEYAKKSKLGCNGLRFDFSGKDYDKADGFSKSDIARAIIESAAHLLSENLADIENRGFPVKKISAIGGITNSAVCMEIIAEVIGRDMQVINGVSAGAVGSAMLAAIGTGAFANEKECFAAMSFEVTEYITKKSS